jgi:hypothetical protein
MITKTKTKLDPANMSQLHTVPKADINCEHTLTHDCPCKPRVEAKTSPAIVTHNRKDEGPDEWLIRYVKGGAV